jgi:hypothetical protein
MFKTDCLPLSLSLYLCTLLIKSLDLLEGVKKLCKSATEANPERDFDFCKMSEDDCTRRIVSSESPVLWSF